MKWPATLTSDVANGRRGHDARSGHAKDSTLVVHGTQVPDVSGIAHPLAAKNGGAINAVAFTQYQREDLRELEVAGALASIRRGDAKNETILAFKQGQGSKAGGLGESEAVAPALEQRTVALIARQR